MPVQGFWGLQLEPGVQYTQKVVIPFTVTLACLPEKMVGKSRSSLTVKVDNDIKYSLCNLTPYRVEQQLLNLNFVEGEMVTFTVRGENAIHLTGNYVFDDDSDDKPQKEQDISKVKSVNQALEPTGTELFCNNDSSVKRDGLKRSADDVHGRWKKQAKHCTEDELERMIALQSVEMEMALRNSSLQHQPPPPPPPRSVNAEKEPSLEIKLINPSHVPPHSARRPLKQSATKKSNVDIQKQHRPLPSSPPLDTDSSESTTRLEHLLDDIVRKDKHLGSGRPAQLGDRVGLRYIGKLPNGKPFAQHLTTPVEFSLDQGRRDWYIGVLGMRKGGERLLTIPSHKISQNGLPQNIPPNTTLTFEVRLVTLTPEWSVSI